MVFTIEKFIEILKDPKCIEFDWEVEGCKVAFYREWHLGNRESYFTVKEWLTTISNFPMKKDITKRTSAWTNLITK